MEIGSIVETVGDFEEIRGVWGLPYPKKGDVLTISGITKHANRKVDRKGIVLLHFEEIPNLPGICDKQINGEPNFVELLLPGCVEELIKAPLEHLMEVI